MRIKVNSKEMEVADNITVSDLKKIVDMPSGSVAVAVNGRLVIASRHAEHGLNDGDDVIVIGAAYGG